MDRDRSLHIRLQPHACQSRTERLSLFYGNGIRLLFILLFCGWFLPEKLCAHLDHVYHCIAFPCVFVLVCKGRRVHCIPSFIRHNRNADQYCLFVRCILCRYPLLPSCCNAHTGRVYFTQIPKRNRRYDRCRYCFCSDH